MPVSAGSPEDILNKLRRIPHNRICPNCETESRLGFGDICVKFQTFVCSKCKTSHQAWSHRVKSVIMSSWTMDEVDALRDENGGGNKNARKTWLGKLNRNDSTDDRQNKNIRRPRPDDDITVFKEFIHQVYDNKALYRRSSFSSGTSLSQGSSSSHSRHSRKDRVVENDKHQSKHHSKHKRREGEKRHSRKDRTKSRHELSDEELDVEGKSRSKARGGSKVTNSAFEMTACIISHLNLATQQKMTNSFSRIISTTEDEKDLLSFGDFTDHSQSGNHNQVAGGAPDIFSGDLLSSSPPSSANSEPAVNSSNSMTATLSLSSLSLSSPQLEQHAVPVAREDPFAAISQRAQRQNYPYNASYNPSQPYPSPFLQNARPPSSAPLHQPTYGQPYGNIAGLANSNLSPLAFNMATGSTSASCVRPPGNNTNGQTMSVSTGLGAYSGNGSNYLQPSNSSFGVNMDFHRAAASNVSHSNPFPNPVAQYPRNGMDTSVVNHGNQGPRMGYSHDPFAGL